MSVLAIAHRAGNSLAGLRVANELGVDVIECDIHHHRGRLEVRHLKTAGPLPFLWDRWELVRAPSQRLGLHELLEADRYGTTLMLDLKGRSPEVGCAVARLLHQGPRPILVCGRNWRAVEAVAKQDFVRPVLSARRPRELTDLWRILSLRRFHGVSVHRSLLDADVVSRLRDQVAVVMTWPVNDVPAMNHLVGIGVNAIISDEPDVLSELVGRRA